MYIHNHIRPSSNAKCIPYRYHPKGFPTRFPSTTNGPSVQRTLLSPLVQRTFLALLTSLFYLNNISKQWLHYAVRLIGYIVLIKGFGLLLQQPWTTKRSRVD
jgi:hypothetical protein